MKRFIFFKYIFWIAVAVAAWFIWFTFFNKVLLPGMAHGQETILTSTVTIDPEDCLYPGQPDTDNSTDDVICSSPTTTVTPPALPSASPTPENNTNSGNTGIPGNPSTSTTNAPAASTCNIAFNPPINLSFHRISSGSVRFDWFQSTDSVDIESLIYGYSSDSLIYGVILPDTSNSYNIDHLASNKIIFAKICAYKNGCEECSEIVDP